MHMSILDETIEPATFNIDSTVKSVEMLEDALVKLDEAKICLGIHFKKNMDFSDCKIMKRDAGDSWRHVECTFVITEGKVCDLCRKTKRTLAKRIERLKKYEGPRQRESPLPPIIREKWRIMRMKLRNERRGKERAQRSIESLRKKIADCRLKLSQIGRQN